jgi:hypothetical protein
MKINKTIHGNLTPYKVRFLVNTMTAEVKYWSDDEPVIGTITEDFKKIILPDTFLSPYITNHGRVPVGFLKLDRRMAADAKDYNDNYLKTL